VSPCREAGWVARLGARGRLALGPAEAFTADGHEVRRRNGCEAAPRGHEIPHGAPHSVVSSVADAVCPSVGTSDDVRAGGRGCARVFAKPRCLGACSRTRPSERELRCSPGTKTFGPRGVGAGAVIHQRF
jgi:hypothetical protein